VNRLHKQFRSYRFLGFRFRGNTNATKKGLEPLHLVEWGTALVTMRVEGQGRFSAQSDLRMGGLWQIEIQLRTSDHRLHKAAVKVLTPY
jgi:nitrogen fixation protein FixH